MIIKDYAKNRIADNGSATIPSQMAILSFEEQCCLCDREIPNGKLLLRKLDNRRVLCLFCILEIAAVEK